MQGQNGLHHIWQNTIKDNRSENDLGKNVSAFYQFEEFSLIHKFSMAMQTMICWLHGEDCAETMQSSVPF